MTASLPLAPHLRIRLDASYQRIGISDSSMSLFYQAPPAVATVKIATAANRWRFPVALQWEPHGHFRVGLGPELSVITGSQSLDEFRNPYGGYQVFPVDYFRSFDRIAIFGVGANAEFPFCLWHFTVAPELHYAHWTSKHYNANFPMDELSAGIGLRL